MQTKKKKDFINLLSVLEPKYVWSVAITVQRAFLYDSFGLEDSLRAQG